MPGRLLITHEQRPINTDTHPFPKRVSVFICVYLWFLLGSCAPQATPTLFVPPTSIEAQYIAPLASPVTSVASLSAPTIVPTLLIPTPTLPCTNNLTYVNDLTIPDGTSVSAGQSIDKQWLVTNSGTCNWDAHYRLKLNDGDAMGVATELALYPARAGAQATLRILFTAPQGAGTYRSAWQAISPDGVAFGDTVFVQIVVQ